MIHLIDSSTLVFASAIRPGRGRRIRVEAPHSPDLIASIAYVPLPTSSYVALASFKGALNVVVAEERVLDGPEDPTVYEEP
jgi:hypothetical protein